MTFGERLKMLRNEAGLSFAQLAEATGLGLATIKDYEGGRRAPLLENAQAITRALGISCESFDDCDFPHTKPGRPRKAAEALSSVEEAGTAAKPPAAKKRKPKK